MSVEIKWSARDEDSGEGEWIVENQTTLLSGEWADCEGNAESAVNDIAEEAFGLSSDADLWEFGDTSQDIEIIVHSPPSIAGEYDVTLDLVVKARSGKRP